MVLAVLTCRAMLPVNMPALVQLVVLSLVGALTYGTLAFVFARQPLQDVFRFFRRR
jgi:hypothetical protein